ncbi:Hypothetical predicted protein [Mytilus galloprovincialis]|uniref:Ig-like domain-containing protein n=1 Tax=Mytilus galloprovincialis TaxID=29158 RepID=A0A8B6GTL4_MYTGA|nr:Hypothetical predicted protein [Mytilus galloprovincialis]
MIVNILWVSVWMVFMVILSEAKVVWEVQKPISEYGEDLELNCIADNYNMSSQSSKRWYQGQTLLTFNDGSEDNTKYNASLYSNGFKLMIKNLTKNDVNITYMCSDGFDKSENLPLRIEDVFKDLHNVTVHTGMIMERDSSIAVIVGIVCGITIICIVIFVFIIVLRRNKDKILTKICYDIQSRDGDEQIPLSSIQPDITDNQQTPTIRPENQQPNRNEFLAIVNEADQSCRLPSNGDIETTRNASVNCQPGSLAVLYDDNIIEPIFVTSRSRLSDCIAPQSQQSEDDDKTISFAADTERSLVSSRPVGVVLPNNDSHISNPNQEEEIIISSAKFPAYSKKRVREQSFTEWSLSEPSKQKMASAGFFYKGCNTYAQCFCCGFNQKWRENDDPFSSSLHNDNCSYSQKVNNSSGQDSISSSPNNEETNPKSME